MERIFNKSRIYNSDCFVADYTRHCQKEEITPLRKVEISDIEPQIDYFKLDNSFQHLPVLAVNVEHYPQYCEEENCEAVLICRSAVKKPWALFVELKYCDPQQTDQRTIEQSIMRNGKKAYGQVMRTIGNMAQVINGTTHNLYANIVLLGLNAAEPYTIWLTQDDLQQIKEDTGVTVYAYQTLMARHTSRLVSKPNNIHT